MIPSWLFILYRTPWRMQSPSRRSRNKRISGRPPFSRTAITHLAGASCSSLSASPRSCLFRGSPCRRLCLQRDCRQLTYIEHPPSKRLLSLWTHATDHLRVQETGNMTIASNRGSNKTCASNPPGGGSQRNCYYHNFEPVRHLFQEISPQISFCHLLDTIRSKSLYKL